MTNIESSSAARHATFAELELGLEHIRAAPVDNGLLEMIVRRPRSNEREVLEAGELDEHGGLIGDRWVLGDARRTDQITMMSSRVIGLLAHDRREWPLAGDQLFADFDLSMANLPPGTRVAVGVAVLEVSPVPHTGCKKFRARYGLDAVRFVGAAAWKELQLRGVNMTIVRGGQIRVGDVIRKLAP